MTLVMALIVEALIWTVLSLVFYQDFIKRFKLELLCNEQFGRRALQFLGYCFGHVSKNYKVKGVEEIPIDTPKEAFRAKGCRLH